MDSKRFEDYKQEVILAYKKKKNEGTLPPNLRDPTTANLKNECLAVFHNRYAEKDSETFKALYGERNSGAEYLQKIRITGADKFKPLDLFLKKNTERGTHNRNIELLAWLIDYEPRPYKQGDLIPEPPSIAIEEKPGLFMILPKFKKTAIAFCAVLVVVTGSYIAYISGQHECMYWDGNQYQSIACDQKIDGAAVIAMDTANFAHVKRITNLSKININDIGKVYYSKVNGKVEFYTGKGENPKDTRKRLLPMTNYIYEKYVLKNPSHRR